MRRKVSLWDNHPLHDGKKIKWATSNHIPEELEGTKLKITTQNGRIKFKADKYKDHWKAWGYAWAKNQLLNELKEQGYSNFLFCDGKHVWVEEE